MIWSILACVLSWQQVWTASDRPWTTGIERSRSGAPFASIARVTFDSAVVQNPLSYDDLDGTNGDQYRVQAINYIGPTSYSNVATCMVLNPVAPGALQAFAVAYNQSVTIPQDLTAVKTTATSITLTWSRTTDPKVKYLTVRVSVNGQPYALILDSKTFPPTATFTHANLTTGTYKYQLRVWDQQDKLLGESNESNVVTI